MNISSDGVTLIRLICAIYNNYEFETQVLVASVRSPQQVVEAALVGGHLCTMPYPLFLQLAKHPLTDMGLKKFSSDWEKMGRQ